MNLDEYYQTQAKRDAQIWTDMDMFKAFIAGVLIGSAITWML